MKENKNQALSALLKYQELDRNLKIIHKKIDKSQNAVKRDRARDKFNEAKKEMSVCVDEAEKLLSMFATLKKYVDDNEPTCNELEVSEDASVDDLREFNRRAESLKNKFMSAESKLSDGQDRALKAIKRYEQALEQGKVMREEFNKFRDAYEKETQAFAPQIEQIEAEMSVLRNQIDPQILSRYNELDEKGLFPPIVEATKGERESISCAGCGMSQSQKTISEFKDNGFCTCENCRRFMYEKK